MCDAGHTVAKSAGVIEGVERKGRRQGRRGVDRDRQRTPDRPEVAREVNLLGCVGINIVRRGRGIVR